MPTHLSDTEEPSNVEMPYEGRAGIPLGWILSISLFQKRLSPFSADSYDRVPVGEIYIWHTETVEDKQVRHFKYLI